LNPFDITANDVLSDGGPYAISIFLSPLLPLKESGWIKIEYKALLLATCGFLPEPLSFLRKIWQESEK